MSKDESQDPQELRTLLRGDHLHGPPEGTLRRALALGAELAGGPSLGEWLVSLIFDSASQVQPAGVRSASAGAERRLLYSLRSAPDTEIREVDFRLRRQGDGNVELVGQVLPPWDDAEVEVRSGFTVSVVKLGAAGDFVVPDLPGEERHLNFTLRGGELPAMVILKVPLPGEDSEPGEA